MFGILNILLDDVFVGDDEDVNVEDYCYGELLKFDFEFLEYDEIGSRLLILVGEL